MSAGRLRSRFRRQYRPSRKPNSLRRRRSREPNTRSVSGSRSSRLCCRPTTNPNDIRTEPSSSVAVPASLAHERSAPTAANCLCHSDRSELLPQGKRDEHRPLRPWRYVFPPAVGRMAATPPTVEKLRSVPSRTPGKRAMPGDNDVPASPCWRMPDRSSGFCQANGVLRMDVRAAQPLIPGLGDWVSDPFSVSGQDGAR